MNRADRHRARCRKAGADERRPSPSARIAAISRPEVFWVRRRTACTTSLDRPVLERPLRHRISGKEVPEVSRARMRPSADIVFDQGDFRLIRTDRRRLFALGRVNDQKPLRDHLREQAVLRAPEQAPASLSRAAPEEAACGTGQPRTHRPTGCGCATARYLSRSRSKRMTCLPATHTWTCGERKYAAPIDATSGLACACRFIQGTFSWRAQPD